MCTTQAIQVKKAGEELVYRLRGYSTEEDKKRKIEERAREKERKKEQAKLLKEVRLSIMHDIRRDETCNSPCFCVGDE